MESSVHVAEVTIHKNQKVSVLVILLLTILKKREREKKNPRPIQTLSILQMAHCSHSHLSYVVMHMDACEQCCCFTLGKCDETASRPAGQRNGNILIYEGRQSVVMLAGVLGLQADIPLLGKYTG